MATNRKIHMLAGPRSAVIALNNVPNHPDSDYAYANDMDGMKCNDADGWYLTGCWNAGSEGDHFAYANGCITNDFDQHSKNDLSINCIKVH